VQSKLCTIPNVFMSEHRLMSVSVWTGASGIFLLYGIHKKQHQHSNIQLSGFTRVLG